MARKTNCTINGKDYYRIYRKVGMKVNKDGIWVDDRKAFYGSSKKEAEQQYQEYMKRKESGLNGSMCLGQHIDEYIDASTERGQKLRKTICEQLNFESLDFQSLEGIIEAIGLEPCKLCTYCWNGKG